MTYHCDPEGNSVDIVLDIDGQAHVITIPASGVARIYTTLRAAQLIAYAEALEAR